MTVRLSDLVQAYAERSEAQAETIMWMAEEDRTVIVGRDRVREVHRNIATSSTRRRKAEEHVEALLRQAYQEALARDDQEVSV